MNYIASPLVLALLPAVARALPSNLTTRAVSVSSVTELGAITQNSYVTARDNGQSAAINGLSYWFFDDTEETDAFLYSTAAVTSDLTASDNIVLTSADWTTTSNTGQPSTTIPLTTAESDFQNAHSASTSGCTGSTDAFCNMQYAFWPAAVIADTTNDRILIAYDKLCRASEGSSCPSTALSGTTLGWGWYEAAVGLGLGERLEPSTGGLTDATGIDDTSLFGGPDSVGFTTGAVVSDGYAYLYGGGNVLTGSYLAKAPISDFTDMSQWTYWDGSSYQSDVSNLSGTLTPGAAGNTVFYSAGLGGFVNIFCPYGSNVVYIQTASAPEGPWSADAEVFTTVIANGDTNYACFAHPEYASADGLTQYISYYQTGTGAQRLTEVVFS